MRRIYFDHNASTPPEPRLVKWVLEQAENFWGNPSSAHLDGENAKRVIEENRAIVAKAINAREREIVFTSWISLGKDNTLEEVEQFLKVLEGVLNRIKEGN